MSTTIDIRHTSDTSPTDTRTRITGFWVWPLRVFFVAVLALCLLWLAQTVPVGLRTTRFLSLYPRIYAGLATLMYFVVAGLIFWQRSDDWLAVLVAVTFLLLGTELSAIFNRDFVLSTEPRWSLLGNGLHEAFFVSLQLLAFLFPSGRFVPRWITLLSVPWVLATAVTYGVPADSSLGFQLEFLPDMVFAGPFFLMLASLGLAQAYRYRFVSSHIERQQSKWIGLGAALVGAAIILRYAVIIPFLWFQIRPAPGSIATQRVIVFLDETLFNTAALFLPIPALFAIRRHRLWDIDFLINRSLVYGALTLLLVLLFAGVLFLISILSQGLLSNPLIGVAITAAIFGAVFQPARKGLRAFVDRRLYGINIDYQQRDHTLAAGPTPIERLQADLPDYTAFEFVGRGGMAEIYRARHVSMNQLMAVKVLPPDLARDPDYLHRFEREASVVTDLRHPNIVTVYHYKQVADTAYIIMEYIHGQSLSDHLRAVQVLSVDRALPIIQHIAAALDFAHTHGVVHRDIKPSNIMLEDAQPPRVVLMDFGIARVVGGRTRLTQTGNMVGTLDFIAPEQIQGLSNIDRRADVYSMGVMVYQMLTGERPFQQQNPGAILIAHLQQPPPDPRAIRPELPAHMGHAILKAMQKSPDDRHESAGVFYAELADLKSKEA